MPNPGTQRPTAPDDDRPRRGSAQGFAVSRRELLAGGGAAVAVASAGALPSRAAARPSARYDWPLGVQLWSVNAQLETAFEPTLRRLARIGYRRVEAAGWHGRSATAFRRAADAAGLRCDSAHVSMPDLNADPAGKIGMARDTGCEYLVCSSPLPSRPLPQGVDWIPGIMQAMTLEAWKRNAALLNTYGAQARQAGLTFGYHNHPAEFALYAGQGGVSRSGYDVLLRETDPDLVMMELDLAWAAAGGQDGAALLRAHPGRFRLLHLKDLAQAPTPGRMAAAFETAEVGRGVIDWRPVFAAAHEAGVRGCYVEQEAPYRRPVFQSLAISRDYLRSLS